LYEQLPRHVITGNVGHQQHRRQYDDDDDDGDDELLPPLSFPPTTMPCFLFCQPQNDAFAQDRLEGLRQFLHDTLVRTNTNSDPGHPTSTGAATTEAATTTTTAAHSAIVSFLELEDLVDDGPDKSKPEMK
jgi:hypothetical protein